MFEPFCGKCEETDNRQSATLGISGHAIASDEDIVHA